MMQYIACLALLCCFFGCSSAPQVPDQKVDTELGVVHDEQADDASDALSLLRDQQLQEQKRQLERQINDPQVNERGNI